MYSNFDEIYKISDWSVNHSKIYYYNLINKMNIIK